MYLVLLFKFSRHLCKGLYQLSRSFCLSHPWGLTFLLSLYHVSINSSVNTLWNLESVLNSWLGWPKMTYMSGREAMTGQRRTCFRKYPNRCGRGHVKPTWFIPQGKTYSRVKACTHNLWKDKTKTISQISFGFRNMFWCFSSHLIISHD